MSWEEGVIRALRSLASPVLDAFFRATTELGGDVLWLLIIFALLALGRRRQALGLSVLVALNFYASYLLKYAIGRPRPPLELQRTDLVEPRTGPSMPSTHAAEAAANLGYVAKELRTKRAYLACAIMAGLAGLSRIYLGVHWPTDVLAGFGLGLATLLAYTILAEGKLLGRLRPLMARRALLAPLPFLLGVLAALLTPQAWGKPSTYVGGLMAGLFTGILLADGRRRGDPRKLSDLLRAAACVLVGLAGLAMAYLVQPGLLQFSLAALTGLWASWLGPKIVWALGAGAGP